MNFKNIVITGTGKYLPEKIIGEGFFAEHKFYTPEGEPVDQTGVEAARKLETITGIKERRYVEKNQKTSDIAAIAAERAIEDAGINPEEIDQIIVGHNFGDVGYHSVQTDILPALASRVKHLLGIENPNCVAFDVVFGCPGWIQGVLQAYAQIKAGLAKTIVVIGADTLSRLVDPNDRDSMIFADGAGATVLQLKEEETQRGILSIGSQSFTRDEVYYLFMGGAYSPRRKDESLFIKMEGRKIYEFALSRVPLIMQTVFDESGYKITDLKKIFIHQANEKMDEAIVKRFYRRYKTEIPENIMPMNIQNFGNSSVATIPTLLDQVRRGELAEHQITEGDVCLFASVGAGMNINGFSYKV